VLRIQSFDIGMIYGCVPGALVRIEVYGTIPSLGRVLYAQWSPETYYLRFNLIDRVIMLFWRIYSVFFQKMTYILMILSLVLCDILHIKDVSAFVAFRFITFMNLFILAP